MSSTYRALAYFLLALVLLLQALAANRHGKLGTVYAIWLLGAAPFNT